MQNVDLRFSVTLSMALRDGDVVQMQEDTGAPIGKLTERNQRRISQTIIHRPAEDKSENWPPINDNCSATKEVDKERVGAVKSAFGANSVENMLVVSLAVPLDKSRGRAGSAATDEAIELLHQGNFNVSVFKQMSKTSADFLVITQDVFDQ